MLGDRLKLLRKQLGLKQKEFAEVLGVRNVSISEYERNSYTPNYAFLCHLKEKYPEINLDWLVTGEGSMYHVDGERVVDPEFQKFMEWYFALQLKNKARVLKPAYQAAELLSE
jgi:transcriptional regulator with XRE-family HTH domain